MFYFSNENWLITIKFLEQPDPILSIILKSANNQFNGDDYGMVRIILFLNHTLKEVLIKINRVMKNWLKTLKN